MSSAVFNTHTETVWPPRHAVIKSFVHQYTCPVLLYCSLAIFPGSTQREFSSILSRLVYHCNVLLKKIVDLHIKACEKFSMEILVSPYCYLRIHLSSCLSQTSTRNNVYGTSTVKQEKIMRRLNSIQFIAKGALFKVLRPSADTPTELAFHCASKNIFVLRSSLQYNKIMQSKQPNPM